MSTTKLSPTAINNIKEIIDEKCFAEKPSSHKCSALTVGDCIGHKNCNFYCPDSQVDKVQMRHDIRKYAETHKG